MINDGQLVESPSPVDLGQKKLTCNRYKKVKKLGEGAYGSVHKCYDNQKHKYIALKKIKFLSEDEGVPINAIRQITSLIRLQHDNIVKLNEVHYHWEQTRLYLDLQFIPENLYDHYKRNFPLSPYAIKSYLFQISKATYFMHSHMIIHRDLKPQNVMVTPQGKIKICDFGQSKILPIYNNLPLTTSIATLWYRAPEVLLGAEQYNGAVDVWAIGTVLAQMVLGKPYFASESEIGQIFSIFKVCGTPSIQQGNFRNCKHLSPYFPKFKRQPIQLQDLCEDGNNLLRQMLEIDPKKRISIGKMLKHDYFQGLS